MKTKKNLSRRDFVKSSAAGVVLTTIPFKACKNIDNDDFDDSDDSTVSSSSNIDADVVQTMVNESIMQLTGETTVADAWKSLMPGIKKDSIIAIKINTRASALPTHPEVTLAVTNGLTQMIVDGDTFPANNIHVYDNFKAYLVESGYTINTSTTGVKIYTESIHSTTSYQINGCTEHFASVLHDKASFLINIGVLKNHYSMAGASLCLKNHFGSVDSPRAFHFNYGDPYIGALNASTPIKSKHVLAMLDCIFGAAEGGPYGSPTFVPNKIIMSQDTVAVDSLGRELLREQNSSTVEWATYIDSAATKYGVGTNDLTKMQIVNITNPTGEKSIETVEASSGEKLCKVVITYDENASTV